MTVEAQKAGGPGHHNYNAPEFANDKEREFFRRALGDRVFKSDLPDSRVFSLSAEQMKAESQGYWAVLSEGTRVPGNPLKKRTSCSTALGNL